MVKLQTIELETLYFFIIAAFLGMTLALSFHKNPQHQTTPLPVMQNLQSQILSPVPTPQEVVSQVTPDGTKKITMTTITNKDLSHVYTFAISNDTDTDKRTLYTIKLPATESMTVPFNTWSPDNIYVFLEHHFSDHTEALLFRADGQQIRDSESSLNVTDIYNARQTGNPYQETTGWASQTLLIVNTKLADGSKGPSYWVEVPSKAVIPLSTVF